MSFREGPFSVPYVGGIEAIPKVYEKAPNVICCVARKKNANLVVYEVVEKNQRLTLDHYWLVLDPTHMEQSRQKGCQHDRCEMSVLDDIAYGFTLKSLSNGTKLQVTLKQIPSHPIIITKKDNKIQGYVKINKRICRLQWVWIEDDGKPWPKVAYADIHAEDCKTGEKVKTRIAGN